MTIVAFIGAVVPIVAARKVWPTQRLGVGEGTTLGSVRSNALAEYAAGTWKPLPDGQAQRLGSTST